MESVIDRFLTFETVLKNLGVGYSSRAYYNYRANKLDQRNARLQPKTPAVIYVDSMTRARLDWVPPETQDKARYRGYYVISFDVGLEEVAYWTGYEWLRTGLEEPAKSNALDYVRGSAIHVRTEIRTGPRGSRNR